MMQTDPKELRVLSKVLNAQIVSADKRLQRAKHLLYQKEYCEVVNELRHFDRITQAIWDSEEFSNANIFSRQEETLEYFAGIRRGILGELSAVIADDESDWWYIHENLYG